MQYTYDDLLVKLKDIGLDLSKATRIEPLDQGEVLIDNNPYSDIVNIFPVAVASAINNLNGEQEGEHKIDAFVSIFLDQLLVDAFKDLEGRVVETKLLTQLKNLKNNCPDLFSKMTESVFINLFLCYSVANKFGLRTCPEKMTGRGYFKYFALLDIYNDLTDDTQTAIFKDLGANNLWDITEKDLEDLIDG